MLSGADEAGEAKAAPANTAGDPQEWLTMTQVAERVVQRGYADTMTRQRVAQLAETDPDWPVPKEQWRPVGRYWLLPWTPLEPYFKVRSSRPGRKGWSKAQPSDAAEGDEPRS